MVRRERSLDAPEDDVPPVLVVGPVRRRLERTYAPLRTEAHAPGARF